MSAAFVAINCAAIPESLQESELFGYEEGAFTGARRGGKKGYFELAHNGTLFLDEIGELTIPMQARLLRAIQQKAIMRVGGDELIPINVRIIAATQVNLNRAIAEERFRRDLFYRLNVLRLNLPPLRERPDDIPILIDWFLRKICQQSGRKPPIFKTRSIRLLQTYRWPGNVRELENVLESLALLSGGRIIQNERVQAIFEAGAGEEREGRNLEAMNVQIEGRMSDIERAVIVRTLEATGFNKTETCRRLGISKSTLWRRLKN
jgi:transcriptional regulator with PAS, ATPase and Fis domain